MNSHIYRRFILLTLVLYASCSSLNQNTATEYVKKELTLTNTPKPVTATSTLLHQPYDTNVMFEAWLQGDYDCSLPCWAGITPGKTRWEETFGLLSEVIDLHVATKPAECRYGQCQYLDWQYDLNGELYSGVMYEKENMVYSLLISGGENFNPNLYEILKKYGQPNQVVISASSFTPEGQPSLTVILLYKDDKFVARYMWWAEFKEDTIEACGHPNVSVLGVVDIDSENWTNIEITQTGRQLNIGTNIENFKLINEVTKLNEAEFYQLGLQSEDTFCISTPLSYWK